MAWVIRFLTVNCLFILISNNQLGAHKVVRHLAHKARRARNIVDPIPEAIPDNNQYDSRQEVVPIPIETLDEEYLNENETLTNKGTSFSSSYSYWKIHQISFDYQHHFSKLMKSRPK